MKNGPHPKKIGSEKTKLQSEERTSKELTHSDPSERLKHAIASAGDGVWDWDLQSNAVVFSKEWKEMVGYEAHEIGNHYSEWVRLVHPEDLDQAVAQIQSHLNGETASYSSEFRMRCKNGDWKWILDRGMITRRDARGKGLRMIGTHVDITARKRVEEALRESEERWKFALEGAGDGLWDWNIQTGQVHYSKRWKEMLGYRENEITDSFEEWQKRIHEDDLASSLAVINAHIEGRIPALSFEVRMLTKKGRWKWILSRGLITSRDGRGKPTRMIGTHVDITERKEAQEREARNLELVAVGAEIPAVLEAIIAGVEAEHPGMICTIKRVDPSGSYLELASAPKLPIAFKKAIHRVEIATSGGCAAEAIRTGRRVIVEDISRAPDWGDRANRANASQLKACWAEPIRGTDGSILGAVSVYHQKPHLPKQDEISSITHAARLIAVAIERKISESALEESEKRFRAIFEQAAVGVAMIDSMTGRFITVNQRYCDMLDMTTEEMQATTFMAITHPDDLGPNLDLMDRMKAGKIRQFKLEKRLKRMDGGIIWVNLAVSAMWEPGSLPDRHVAVVEDITSTRQAEAALKESEQMNRALLDHTSALIVVTDNEGRITHLNQAVTKQFGCTVENVHLMLPWETGVMRNEDAPKSKERFNHLLEGQENPPRELRLRGKDGKWHLVETRSTFTRRADGTIDRFIITGTDMTERRRLEQEVLKISEQEQANIGHNLHDGVGQTLTGIGSLLDSLEATLEGEAKRATNRIRELMKQAVSEVRRMSHGLSPVAVQHRGLAGGLQLLAETIRINFRREAICEIDPGIVINDGDKEAHLFRIAQEAVNNALRHGKCTQILLRLARKREEECLLEIIDNGRGFKGGKSSQKSGIGLRVMGYRANLIGAEIDVQSKPRKGVTVSCTFSCQAKRKRAKTKAERKSPKS
jgi:PAS domain S-box-containing protein